MILLKTLTFKNPNKVINKKEFLNKEIKTIFQFNNNIKKFASELNLLKRNIFQKSTKSRAYLKQNLIDYTIKINLTPTNTFINVTDIKGNLKQSISAGTINLSKKQKTQQPNALIQMLKLLFLKSKFLQNKIVSLQFKNTKPYYETIIIQLLKTKIFIKSLKSYNLYPHNGCRPKKLKRFKRRTRRVTLR